MESKEFVDIVNRGDLRIQVGKKLEAKLDRKQVGKSWEEKTGGEKMKLKMKLKMSLNIYIVHGTGLRKTARRRTGVGEAGSESWRASVSKVLVKVLQTKRKTS